MYINETHIAYYAVFAILGLFVGMFIDWMNRRLPDYKKVFSKEIFTSFNTVAAPYFFVTCEISIISLIYTSLSAHQCSFLTIISCFLPKNTAKNVSTAISSTYIPST